MTNGRKPPGAKTPGAKTPAAKTPKAPRTLKTKAGAPEAPQASANPTPTPEPEVKPAGVIEVVQAMGGLGNVVHRVPSWARVVVTVAAGVIILGGLLQGWGYVEQAVPKALCWVGDICDARRRADLPCDPADIDRTVAKASRGPISLEEFQHTTLCIGVRKGLPDTTGESINDPKVSYVKAAGRLSDILGPTLSARLVSADGEPLDYNTCVQMIAKASEDGLEGLKDLGATLFPSDPICSARAFKAAAKIDPDDIKVLNNLGLLYVRLTMYPEAIAAYERASKLVLPEDLVWRAALKNNLGAAYDDAGQPDKARAAYREALQLYERLRDRSKVAQVRNNLASLDIAYAQDSGDLSGLPKTRQEVLRAQVIFIELNNDEDIAITYQSLGVIDLLEKDQLGARKNLAKAEEYYRKAKSKDGLLHISNLIAQIDINEGRWDAAEVRLRAQRANAKAQGSTLFEGTAIIGLADVAEGRKDRQKACILYRESEEILRPLGGFATANADAVKAQRERIGCPP